MAKAVNELDELIGRLESGWLPDADGDDLAHETEPAALRHVDADCWHCRNGRCTCITCAQLNENGPCVLCHGRGKVETWVQ
jgi:hypothetical protein